MLQTPYIDVHSHLNLSQFDADREETYQRMRDAGVSTITIGVDLATSQSAISFAETHDGVWACIGLHPTDTKTESFDPEVYSELLKSKKVVALGECGLDYFRGADDEEKKRQREVFAAHIAFAKEKHLPLMLHGRPSKGSMDAYGDMLDMLEAEQGPELRGNAHFFVGDLDIAKRFFAIGFTVSYPGIITFSHDYDEVIAYAPIDRLLSETDSPFAAPEPYRGKRNEPAYVVEVVKALARVKGVSEGEMAAKVSATANRLFFS